MGAHSADLDDLVQHIHASALTDSGWESIGDTLRRALSADSALLLRVGTKDNPEPWTRLIGFNPESIAPYASHWARQDLWYRGAIERQRVAVGMVSLDDQLIDRREFRASAFFNEFLRDFDTDRMINVCLIGPAQEAGYGAGALSFYRGVGKDPFSEEDAGLLSRVAPHLTIAAQNYWSARSCGVLQAAYPQALNAVGSALFVVQGNGRLIFANAAGEMLCRERKWVQLSNQHIIAAKNLRQPKALSDAIRRLRTGLGFTMVVTDELTNAQAVVSAAPISPDSNVTFRSHRAAFVWVTPVVPDRSAARAVARLFALTPAEEKLLGQLLQGEGLNEAAAALRISTHTARTQLKSVFRKTGYRSQVQLVVFASRLSGIRTAT